MAIIVDNWCCWDSHAKILDYNTFDVDPFVGGLWVLTQVNKWLSNFVFLPYGHIFHPLHYCFMTSKSFHLPSWIRTNVIHRLARLSVIFFYSTHAWIDAIARKMMRENSISQMLVSLRLRKALNGLRLLSFTLKLQLHSKRKNKVAIIHVNSEK